MTDNSMTEAAQSLAQKISFLIGELNQLNTPISGLRLSRWPMPTEPTSYMHGPSICLIAQGKKCVVVGEEHYTYDPFHFLISAVDLPVMSNIIEATTDSPFLGIVMKLDLQVISQLIVDSQIGSNPKHKAHKGIAIGNITVPLFNAFERLLDLMDEPDSIKILAPIIKKEIFYRLLMTNQGTRLSQMVTEGSHSHHIAKAIDWLKDHYTKPLNVVMLATESGMSKSAFYHHFREITAMTPLQFQKKLRLNEARRLMLTENLDAATTTFKVGYESQSQFNREYKRMFGHPPARDIKIFREMNVNV